MAKHNQQKAQLASQIATILQTSIPIDFLIKSIEDLNTDDVSLLTANFSVNARDEMLMRLRARALSRPATENFIVLLSNQTLFSEVFSPLSNLVGKGERFINIDLTIDPIAVFDSLHGTNDEEVTADPSATQEGVDAIEETESDPAPETPDAPAGDPAPTTNSSDESL
ncbi:hypothetical protein IPJ72_05230 [Candidatus Peregrinibacteria bacterium]|nr:MAG: hypothetical protein IPJ72_05230 [Candidatus Peregrinibacteria bacterium]